MCVCVNFCLYSCVCVCNIMTVYAACLSQAVVKEVCLESVESSSLAPASPAACRQQGVGGVGRKEGCSDTGHWVDDWYELWGHIHRQWLQCASSDLLFSSFVSPSSFLLIALLNSAPTSPTPLSLSCSSPHLRLCQPVVGFGLALALPLHFLPPAGWEACMQPPLWEMSVSVC